MVFPSAYQLSSTLLIEDSVLLVKGKVKRAATKRMELTALEIAVPDLSSGRERRADRDHACPPFA